MKKKFLKWYTDSRTNEALWIVTGASTILFVAGLVLRISASSPKQIVETEAILVASVFITLGSYLSAIGSNFAALVTGRDRKK